MGYHEGPSCILGVFIGFASYSEFRALLPLSASCPRGSFLEGSFVCFFQCGHGSFLHILEPRFDNQARVKELTEGGANIVLEGVSLILGKLRVSSSVESLSCLLDGVLRWAPND